MNWPKVKVILKIFQWNFNFFFSIFSHFGHFWPFSDPFGGPLKLVETSGPPTWIPIAITTQVLRYTKPPGQKIGLFRIPQCTAFKSRPEAVDKQLEHSFLWINIALLFFLDYWHLTMTKSKNRNEIFAFFKKWHLIMHVFTIKHLSWPISKKLWVEFFVFHFFLVSYKFLRPISN